MEIKPDPQRGKKGKGYRQHVHNANHDLFMEAIFL